MQNTITQVVAADLENGLANVLASPADAGRLHAIFVRPTTNERTALTTAKLSLERGIDGDRWFTDSYNRLKDGRSDPRCQVSLMNARFLRQIAGEEDGMCQAGDNLIVDFDLSDANLPTGSQLAIGAEAIVEISDLKHTGCSKFARRYGEEAREFANNKRGAALHLRGRYARIVRGGNIRIGNIVTKLAPS